jgi:Family of unknown function (DUF6527)
MKKDVAIVHEFVEFIPEKIAERTLYISIPYATAVHNCFCGCGTKVVTPIHPTGWRLTFDGDTVSLYPSVGNHQYPCQSHYWVERGRAIWAPDMTQEQIRAGRAHDRAARERYFSQSSLRPAVSNIAPKRKWRLVDWLLGR